ncbi:TolC family outer membrane protein [Phreatobacter cathodiphilus]|uniref:Channel protein TolC n=1 Tax=Phreatobacter cathodiphilus TaxID=1868589 RepID=A0A2S0NAV0_9HYPH|nr:TolC family outer membrane protein [Phreatobacter cathodiphilus]AVO45061.1 channel protein TolC [Phreatobacter cathodiphilus]
MTGATRSRARSAAVVSVAFASIALSVLPAGAQSIEQTLVQAYRNNPDLNSARASVRVANEGLPAALSGYRPSVSATITAAGQVAESSVGASPYLGTINGSDRTIRSLPRAATLSVTQPLFDGNRTTNSVRQADQNVLVARETLRNTEQTVLLASATAHMNVLREQAVLDLRRRNVEVLREQLRATRDRFNVGEVTRTDVALAESALQAAIATATGAESDLANARSVYMQQVGVQPGRLTPARTIERLLPRSLDAAIIAGQSEHPSIRGARHGADAQLLQVRIAESALYPTLGLSASVTRAAEQSSSSGQSLSGSLGVTLTIPIFANGGRDYSTIRAAKETYGQRRIQIETAAASVRQAVTQSWAALEAARAQIQAAEVQVRSQDIAVNGIREEYKVGQRTIIDVLNATQNLTEARVSLVRAQRDRVVLSYSVLSAMGRLSGSKLALRTEIFDPTVHYNQVRDQWIGVRTPDGR